MKLSLIEKIKLGLAANDVADKAGIGYVDRIKIGLEVKKMASEVSNNGVKSSAFIMSAIALIGTFGGMFIGKIPPETLALIVTVIVPAYAIARAITKRTASTKDDEILAAIEKNILSKFGIKPLAEPEKKDEPVK